MAMAPARTGYITRNATLPTTDYTGRRLVIAPDSFDRIVTLAPRWWESDDLTRQCRWNASDFATLIDATMAPDSMMVVDLTRKRGDHWTRMYLSTLLKLGGLDDLLRALHGKIGGLSIHHGYDLRTNAMPSVDFDCGGSSSSVVHLIAADVWHDLFQLYHDRSGSLDAEWVSVLASLAGLPEPLHVLRALGPMVDPGYKSPFDEIVKVEDGFYRFRAGQSPSLTAYATTHTEG